MTDGDGRARVVEAIQSSIGLVDAYLTNTEDPTPEYRAMARSALDTYSGDPLALLEGLVALASGMTIVAAQVGNMTPEVVLEMTGDLVARAANGELP